MIKCLIIDDERLARQELRRILEQHKNIEILDECANAEEAITKIEELKPDLIFLDIQMPGKSGFDVLEEVIYTPEVIFVTAYDEFALKAFEVSALDYILKPVEENRFDESLKKVIDKIESKQQDVSYSSSDEQLGPNDQVFVKDGDKCWFVELGDIRLFESEGNYVRVYFENNKPLILKSLNNLDKKLSDKLFFRANRKHIVNLKWIDKIETWFNGGLLVILKDDKKIEISRRQAVKLKDRMSL
ncbi:MAG: two-component system LytT family response regulator [Salibacteraceae bacterium]|jgi:two-component system LytT family response regulator